MSFPTWTRGGYTGPLIGDGIALALHHPFGEAPQDVWIADADAKASAIETLATFGTDAAYALHLKVDTTYVPLVPAALRSKIPESVTWNRPGHGPEQRDYRLKLGQLGVEIPPLTAEERDYASGSAWYGQIDGTWYCIGVTKSANMLILPREPAVMAQASSALTADFNGDGAVDFNDQLILSRNYNKAGTTRATGDATGDGRTNFIDLLELSKQYGKRS